MKQLLELRGIITVLNTPFREDDTIDVTGLKKNVDYGLDAEVAGFLVPAMASEVDKLSARERELIVRTVVDSVAGRAVVIGGASAPTTNDRLRLTERLSAIGCDGVLVSIPYESDDQYRADVHAVADAGPGFLMIQDWDASGYGLPVPLIVELFNEVNTFRCLKIETVPAGVKYSQVLAATEGRLNVSGGWAVTQIIEGLDRGVHAFMPTGLHRVYSEIYWKYQTRDRTGARRLFDELLPILAFSNQHLDISIHFFKRLLHAQGIYATCRVRPPIMEFDEYHERVAADLIQRAMALENRFNV